MRFVCDFDGIAYPFVTAVASHPRGRGLSIANCVAWETPLEVVGREHWPEAWAHAISYETMRTVGLYPDFAPAMSSLRARGIEALVMTHRPPEAVVATRRLLDDAGLDWLEVRAAAPAEKISFCLAEGVRVIVDDHPKTIARAHEAGLEVMSLLFPYNSALIEELQVVNAADWTTLEGLLVEVLTRQL